MGAIVPTVFHRKGQPIKNPRNAWNRACVKAGNPGAWFHDLRRSAVRNMERAGVSRSVLMKVTGHKTESIYKRYAIADVVSLEKGLKKLAGQRRHRRSRNRPPMAQSWHNPATPKGSEPSHSRETWSPNSL